MELGVVVERGRNLAGLGSISAWPGSLIMTPGLSRRGRSRSASRTDYRTAWPDRQSPRLLIEQWRVDLSEPIFDASGHCGSGF